MVPHDRVQLPSPGVPLSAVCRTGSRPHGRAVVAPAHAAVKPMKKDEVPAVKDAFREVVETVVFVVVLVLMLKTFVAEAFVIPTGSMAETLLGYQKWDLPAVRARFPSTAPAKWTRNKGRRSRSSAAPARTAGSGTYGKRRDDLRRSSDPIDAARVGQRRPRARLEVPVR